MPHNRPVCGRYSLSAPPDLVAEVFGLARDAMPELAPRFNIAPTQEAPVVRVERPGEARNLALLSWGLIPAGAEHPAAGGRLINARSETAATRPAFRTGFRHRRCLVPADGFYEWKALGTRKHPYFVRREDGAPLGLAGLWDRWEGPGGGAIESFTILTTAASPLIARLHDRMPAIVAPEDFEAWLDPAPSDPGRIAALLAPWERGGLTAYPVSDAVNDPRHDAPDCIAPVAEEPADGPQPRLPGM